MHATTAELNRIRLKIDKNMFFKKFRRNIQTVISYWDLDATKKPKQFCLEIQTKEN